MCSESCWNSPHHGVMLESEKICSEVGYLNREILVSEPFPLSCPMLVNFFSVDFVIHSFFILCMVLFA